MMCTLHNKPRTGNRVEPSPNHFLAEGSDKRLSTQYLRPNIQPIYHKGRTSTKLLWFARSSSRFHYCSYLSLLAVCLHHTVMVISRSCLSMDKSGFPTNVL